MSYTPAAGSNNPAAGGGAQTGSTAVGATPGSKRQRTERTSGWRGGSSTDMQPLRKYTATAPPGTAPLHSTCAYGTSDFAPAVAGNSSGGSGSTQEVGLSERTIRYGFVDTAVVDNEHQSSHLVVQSRLQDTRVMQELQAFAAGVAQRQQARGGLTGSPVPRMGTRSVGSDEQRDQWVRALRNPRVPLSTLVARMPFTLRNTQLLDSLVSQAVPRGRAVWAIRVAGLVDMAGAQTRDPTQKNLLAGAQKHTAAWTRLVMQHVERTLASAPTGQDGDAAGWAHVWKRCTFLLHAQYAAGLVDQRMVVGWLAGLLRQLAPDLSMLALHLVSDYVDEIARSRTPLRKLLAALAQRLDQARAYRALQPFASQLRGLLQRLFTMYPDAFVEPSTWPAYRAALQHPGDDGRGRQLVELVEARNHRFAGLLPAAANARHTVESGGGESRVLRVLARLAADGDVRLAFRELFEDGACGAKDAAQTLRLVCFWAVDGATQQRMLLAAALCRLMDMRWPGAVQGAVTGFLDAFSCGSSGPALHNVVVLLERLSDARCFSVPRYLRLLTARGDLVCLHAPNDSSASMRARRHLAYATGLPVRTPEERALRQTLLFDCPLGQDAAATETEEVELEAECRALREAVSAVVPFMAAYACAGSLRAHRGRRPPSLDAGAAAWWLPAALASADLLDARQLPTPQHFAPTLSGPLATAPCTHDWLAPLSISAGVPPASSLVAAEHLLRGASRRAVHLVVGGRLLPLVYDFVVRDVEVGEDNWRVITQPGSSLLNRRQAASLVRLLAAAHCPGLLLDLLLWLLPHTRAPEVAALAHRALRRYTSVWRLLGRLDDAVGAVRAAYEECAGRGGAADAFDYDALVTARCWAAQESAQHEVGQPAAELLARVLADYRRFVAAQTPVLLPLALHATTASAELVQLARQLARDPSADEAQWAARACFLKLARSALAQTPSADASQLLPGAVLETLATDAAATALCTARALSSAAADDQALRATLVDACVRCVCWYAVAAGHLFDETTSADRVSDALLRATERAARSAHVDVSVDARSARAWVAGLLSCGVLSAARLVSWTIAQCQTHDVSTGHLALLTGVLEALAASEEGEGSPAAHECLEVSAVWHTALDAQPPLRMQAVELVFSAASAAGRLRSAHPTASQQLLQAAARLAHSAGVQSIVDRIPSSATASSQYYSVLDIYRANIEPQLADPLVPPPAKRAVLRVLMALCEGFDPAAGFSAMTTAEVAHRIHESLARFWYTEAANGRRPGAHAAVAKLATVVNALLLFAASALQASEASTDAFAAAPSASSGATLARDSSASASAAAAAAVGGLQDAQRSSSALDLLLSDQVQFVSDATAYLSTCVLDALMHWDTGDTRALALLPWRSAALADALVTLSPDIALTLVDSCASALFALNTAHLRALDDRGVPEDTVSARASDTAAPPPLDRRVAAVIDAARTAVPRMLEPLVALATAHEADEIDRESAPDLCAPEVLARGNALARTIQQLVASLADHADGSVEFAPASLLAALRDFAAAVLAQLQALAAHMGFRAARLLGLRAAAHLQSPGATRSAVGVTLAADADADAAALLTPGALRLAVLWRLQAVQPLCALMRAFPDEFAVGEWLMTLVTLCLSPECHETSSKPAATDDTAPAGGVLSQYLLDFAAITNESLTASMRKHTLGLLKSATPLLNALRTRVPNADVLSRLFPFDVSTSLTRDLVHLTGAHSAEPSGLDNPWMWLEALEFVPLDSLRSTAIPITGLEGMTPFTLRGTIEQENAQRARRALHGAPLGVQSASGYLAGVRLGSSDSSTVPLVRGLQYLENPYFPMRPAFLLPLAETPVEWRVFSAKRRRVDAETRLVWRNQCESAFGRKKLA